MCNNSALEEGNMELADLSVGSPDSLIILLAFELSEIETTNFGSFFIEIS